MTNGLVFQKTYSPKGNPIIVIFHESNMAQPIVILNELDLQQIENLLSNNDKATEKGEQ